MTTHCESCGKPWDEHDGIALVCAENKRLRDAVEVARESRDAAESKAKEAVQAEMAALRAPRCPRCKEATPAKIDGPVLFLDIDGVLNDHRFNGIDQRLTEVLNSVLFKVLSLKIVISSAWRYELIDGDMTLSGFETMLRACGLRCAQRVVGYTEDNGRDFDNDGRAETIRAFAAQHSIAKWAAIDDMPLALPVHRFVQTNGDVGITSIDAERLLAIFTGKSAVRKPQ